MLLRLYSVGVEWLQTTGGWAEDVVYFAAPDTEGGPPLEKFEEDWVKHTRNCITAHASVKAVLGGVYVYENKEN